MQEPIKNNEQDSLSKIFAQMSYDSMVMFKAIDKMKEEEEIMIEQTKATATHIKKTNTEFKKKCFLDAQKVLFQAVDEDFSKDMLKDLIHCQIKYLFETYFGC